MQAITPAAVMSDRLCIESKGKELIHISDEDLITCCKSCSDFENTCDGGMHHKVWEYWRDYGIVSGGGHDSMTVSNSPKHSIFANTSIHSFSLEGVQTDFQLHFPQRYISPLREEMHQPLLQRHSQLHSGEILRRNNL